MATFILATVLLNSPSTWRVGKDTLPTLCALTHFTASAGAQTLGICLSLHLITAATGYRLFFFHCAGGMQMGQDFKESLSLKELLQHSKGNLANCYRFHTGVLEGTRDGARIYTALNEHKKERERESTVQLLDCMQEIS